MFAEILIDHAFARKQNRLTYSVPETLNLKAGDGVLVPFQKSEKAGVVLRVHNETPDFSTKEVLSLLSEQGLLQTTLFGEIIFRFVRLVSLFQFIVADLDVFGRIFRA